MGYYMLYLKNMEGINLRTVIKSDDQGLLQKLKSIRSEVVDDLVSQIVSLYIEQPIQKNRPRPHQGILALPRNQPSFEG